LRVKVTQHIVASPTKKLIAEWCPRIVEMFPDLRVTRIDGDTHPHRVFEALHDHGDPQPDTVERDVDSARAVIDGLAAAGVDYDDLTLTIEREGVGAFARSYHDFIAALDKRKDEITT